MNELSKLIVEKGRFAQWLGLIMCGTIAGVGGAQGWLNGAEVKGIVTLGVLLAGGVELAKIVGKTE